MCDMERPSFDVLSFLAEPGRPASVAVAYPGLAGGPPFYSSGPAAFLALGG